MSDFLERISKLSPKRLALLAAELQEKLEEAQSRRSDPVAVVGLACRFPGAETPEEFWELLRSGTDAIREVPKDRWDVEALYDPDPDAPGKVATRWGGFLPRVDLFDPGLFGISPREALSMDPQQRLMLEVAWEALESAGIAPDRLYGSPTGVFVGVCNADYYQVLGRGGVESFDLYRASGNAASVASGRVAYVLGFQGPAITVDTACSSSLVAVHLACQSLSAGDCQVALAGGVNVICSPETTVALSRSHMMAPDGRCKAFDARADGFVRGEGCGVVVLKLLADAQADGDRILAVIRGSACNQDGRSSGLTAPNGPSQEAVIRAALGRAGIAPADVGYVEAHGTGTSLGDPIEARALGSVLRPGRDASSPVLIGSVKTNFGHLESAAGIAGLIKVVLSLQHQEIPQSLHLQTLSPHVDWSALPLRVSTERTPWLRGPRPRIAGVSSFGFSGTNAHVVLAEAPLRAGVEAQGPQRPLHLLTISARSGEALRKVAERLEDHLAAGVEGTLADVAHTCNVGRSQLAHRAALIAGTLEQAREKLRAIAEGREMDGVWRSKAGPETPRVAFLFPGQGCEYPGMARDLYESQAVFRAAVDACAELVTREAGWSLTSVIFGEESELLSQTAYTQPALFAIQWGLSELWRSWGVEPSGVVGHSFGECVAACTAGALTWEDGLRLVMERGRLMATLPPGGGMGAVAMSEERAVAEIAGYAGRLSVSAVNGPQSVVVSGERGALLDYLSRLDAAGVWNRELPVSLGAHSPLVEPMLPEYRRAAQRLRYAAPTKDYISNVSGRVWEEGELGAEYWVEHTRRPVRFGSGIAELKRLGYELFVDLGPHPVLAGMALRDAGETSGLWVGSLRRGFPDWPTILEALGRLWTKGARVDWHAFDRGYARKRLALPTYPFDRDRYWADTPGAAAQGTAGSPTGHRLLGRRLRAAVPTFEAVLQPSGTPLFAEHRVFGIPLAAAPVFVEMALSAAALAQEGDYALAEVELKEPLAFSDGAERVVQLVLVPRSEPDAWTANLYALPDGDDGTWILHATARVSRRGPSDAPAPDGLDEVRSRCSAQDPEAFYDALRRRGIDLGPTYRGLELLWRGSGECVGRARVPSTAPSERYRVHPALLDACLQVAGAAVPGDWEDSEGSTYLLAGLESVSLGDLASSGTLWSHARLRPGGAEAGAFLADVWLYDDSESLVGQLGGLLMKRSTRAALQRAVVGRSSDWLYELDWPERPLQGQRLSPPSAAALPGADELTAAMGSAFARLASENRLSESEAALPPLDSLATLYWRRALSELGWRPEPGERTTLSELTEELRIADGHQRLFRRMLGQLAEDGFLRLGGEAEGIEVLRAIEVEEDPASLAQQIAGRHPEVRAELTLLDRCGPRLAEVMRGDCDPLHLLFQGGSFDATQQLYEHTPYARAMNSALRDLVARLSSALPKGRPLRVLEIGGGTGGSTSSILPALPPDGARYLFTDLSRLFLSRAEERFRDYPFVQYALLDIERPPSSQGVAAHAFDVVLAANVLHATRDLRQTLAHAREVLAPGGLLVLLEGTKAHRWVDLTFGLTEGWWRFSDTALRDGHPLIAASQWVELLRQEGFVEAAFVPGSDRGEQAIVVARGPTPPRESASPHPATSAAAWLVLSDRGEVGAKLTVELERAGARVSVLAPGSGTADELSQAVAAAVPHAAGAPIRVAYLRGLDLEISDDMSAADVVDDQVRASEDLAQLVRTLVDGGHGVAARLWIVTRGAQHVQGDAGVVVPQAALWGLGRVIALEHTDLWGGLVDLDPSAGPDDVGALIDEIVVSDGEDQIAFRSGARRVARLRRARSLDAQPMRVRRDGRYLVTGAFGGLGLGLARWLAAHGAGGLVLTSRRGLPDRAAWEALAPASDEARIVAAVRDIEALGTKVDAVAVDVSDVKGMKALVDRIGAEDLPLRGVFHLAADIHGGPVTGMEHEPLESMFRSKVGGSWLLHRLTRDLDLDAFVLYSSTTALLGVAGLGSYAAANQFLDALAHRRRGDGRPGLAVNWGIWEIMRRASASEQQQFREVGLLPLPMEPALDAMGGLVGAGVAQAMVASVDWSALRAVYESRRRRPLLEDLGGGGASLQAATSGQDPATADLVRRLLEAPPAGRRDVVLAHVCSEAARVLGIDPGQPIDVEEGFFEMGMDSLMSVELKSRLEAAVGRSLPSTLTFNYPNAEALTGYLFDKVLSDVVPNGDAQERIPAPSAAQSSSAKAQDLDTRDDLSEDELAALLAARLQELDTGR